MGFTVEADYWLKINGKECEVKVIGTCQRDLLGRIECEVRKVLSEDGLDLFGVVPEEHMEPMRIRLWNAALEQRHPYGEGIESAV